MNITLPTWLQRNTSKKPQKIGLKPQQCLLVYNENLLYLGTGEVYQWQDFNDTYQGQSPDAVTLAKASQRLLASVKKPKIALALAENEFVATTVNLPGVKAENLANAVRLQQNNLLPGVDGLLLLAVYALENTDEKHQHVALWLSANRADALYQAFQAVSLDLVTIIPRPFAGIDTPKPHYAIYSEDQHSICQIAYRDDVLIFWQNLLKDDLDDEQLQTTFSEQQAKVKQHSDIHIINKTSLADWELSKAPITTAYQYGFIPPAAAHAFAMNKKRSFSRKLRWGLGFVLFCLVVAGLTLANYERNLDKRLRIAKDLSAETSRLREEIIDIDGKLEPINKYPKQAVAQLLLTLNNSVPPKSWLTRLKIEDGLIELEGESGNPAEILEALTNNPAFMDVKFSKSLQGRRFGIRLRLVDINIEQYLEEYFPTEIRY